MNELAQASRALVDKAFGLLEVFDLSFFVSGAALVGALFFADLLPGAQLLLGASDNDLSNVPALGWAVLVVASYIAGLACFSLGRSVGRRVHGWFGPRQAGGGVFELLAQHGLLAFDEGQWTQTKAGEKIVWLGRYLDVANQSPGGSVPPGVQSAVYVRMWAELRTQQGLANSFGLLRRYWVSAATLDGLLVAGGTWAAVLWLAHYPWGAAASAVGACCSSFEARRYDAHQRRELVATMAQLYDL